MEPVSPPGAAPRGPERELAGLLSALIRAESEREARLERTLAALEDQMQEASRVQKLITGGAARREARLRALEQTVEEIAAEHARILAPRPLDLPTRNRFDASVIDMRWPDRE